jgi:diguanylate cyclase (GGDEF)-like protein
MPIHHATAQHTAFAQCVHALRRTLATTPLGWLLICWVSGGPARSPGLWLWLGIFALGWLCNMLLLRAISRAGPAPARHGRQLLGIAALDGACWGALTLLVMGDDAILNAWLAAILCGVAAVNAPVYITWIRAYRAQIGALWLLVGLGTLLHPGRPQGLEGFIGLSVFLLLIGDYMHRIAARVVEGIRLQIANAELAEQLREALAASQQQAATDPLTGLPNRRALDELLRQQLGQAARQRSGFAVLMLDLDHFKAVNDSQGHAVGDRVLQAFAARVRAQLRDGDSCARYGGEEFVVVLPGASLALALEVAERLRACVAGSALLSQPAVAVTVSIGAAAHRPGDGATDLLARADAAVYEAKRSGRNRVCAAA